MNEPNFIPKYICLNEFELPHVPEDIEEEWGEFDFDID